MGGFGTVLRSIGSVGNEVQSAQTGLQDLNQKLAETKVKNLMDQLNLKLTQQKLDQGAQDPLERQAAAAEKVLGRKLTPDERKVLLGLAPIPPTSTQTIDKTALRGELLNLANDDKATPIERRVYTSLLQDIDAGGDLKDIMGKKQAFQSSRTEVSPVSEKPVIEVFNGKKWQQDIGKNIKTVTINGKQVPATRDSTGQYVYLGEAKEDTGGVASTFDSSIQAAAAGRINPPSPASKGGAAWWARAKELGLDDQIKTRSFTTRATAQDLVKLEAQFQAVKNITGDPTVQQSQALADIADKVFGGTTRRQDLIDRGKRSALMGLRSPYAPAAYPKEEFKDIVNMVQTVFDQRNSDLSDLGAVPAVQ